MKIVIVGAGKIGSSLAFELANEDHDITVVEKDKEKMKLLSDTLDVMALCGNGAAMAIQREANVGDSDLLIAVTGEDELNMLACIVARKLGCKNTIARVRNREYTEQLYMLKSELGLSMTINPELLAAKEIYRLLQIPAFIKRDTFAEGEAEALEFAVTDATEHLHERLMDIKLKPGILIVCINHMGRIIIPGGQDTLASGDTVVIVTTAGRDILDLNDIFA